MKPAPDTVRPPFLGDNSVLTSRKYIETYTDVHKSIKANRILHRKQYYAHT